MTERRIFWLCTKFGNNSQSILRRLTVSNFVGRTQTLTQIPSTADTLYVAHWKFGPANRIEVAGPQHDQTPTAEHHQDLKFRARINDLNTSYSPST